jgi:hypothetical protein
MLNVVRRPKLLCGDVVPFVEQRIEGFEHERFVLIGRHTAIRPSSVFLAPNAASEKAPCTSTMLTDGFDTREVPSLRV